MNWPGDCRETEWGKGWSKGELVWLCTWIKNKWLKTSTVKNIISCIIKQI